LTGVAKIFDHATINAGDFADMTEVELFAILARKRDALAKQHIGAAKVQIHRPTTKFLDLCGDRFVSFVGENFLDNFQRGIVGVATSTNFFRCQSGGCHGSIDSGTPAMHEHRAHADGFHEDDIEQHVP